ncbi:hypothetical protein GCM10009682_38680 [Luedemannella flava]|uniref:Uncharacterized protein n=1 Tax=Luedemannella flava TaxID=349316 RepID=A0ABN2M9M6_9ACTN
MSHSPNHMEVFWVGPSGSIEGAYHNGSDPWQRHHYTEAGVASPTSAITSVSHSPNHMEVLWTMLDGSVDGIYHNGSDPWQRHHYA